ncbi:MAG: YvcK family protein [Chloroflexi bacterium]|nr:YvcK family protein [Chloroflexota bacterium]
MANHVVTTQTGVSFATRYLRLLAPGLGIKRWIGLGGFGWLLVSLGLLYLLAALLGVPLPSPLPSVFTGLLLLVAGGGVGLFSLMRLLAALPPGFLQNAPGPGLVDAIYRYRVRERGPKVVAIGGGTGLSTLLRGLKEHTANLTAIVTVADDGGSSGALRRELGVLPPGDIRNCLVALAEAEPLMTRLFQYRFGEGSSLQGHSFGNLFLVAMSGVTGSFEEAIQQSSRVLAIRGRVLPSTLASLTLSARMQDEVHVRGESQISEAGKHIRRLSMEPGDPPAYEEAVEAIQSADLIVLGPGSLYTSVLPNLLVPGIQEALRNSRAVRVYVCNVATQPGETDGYSGGDHIRALHRHVGRGLFQYTVVNNNVDATLPSDWPNAIVPLADLPVEGVETIYADVVNPDYRLRHDPDKLAKVLLNLYDRVKVKA